MSTKLSSVKSFQAKLEQIKQHPNQLRRTIAYWPYYETLQKILIPLSPQDVDDLKNFFLFHSTIQNGCQHQV
jgi:hypothetical protein